MKQGRRRFRTKLVVVAGVGLVAGLAASLAAALLSVGRLSNESAGIIENGLTTAIHQYFATHLGATAQRTREFLDRAFAEVETIADFAQMLHDHQDDMDAIAPVLQQQPLFSNNLERVVGKNGGLWYENGQREGCTTGVWREQLDAQERIPGALLSELGRTQLLDVLLPVMSRHGVKKQWLYYVGSREATFIRNCPWSATYMTAYDTTYPDKNSDNWWTFFPGLYDTWQQWTSTPDRLGQMPSQITVTAPYHDAGGAGEMISIFHPVWRSNRRALAGLAGMDITLTQITRHVEDVRVADSGFAFLAQPSGNILAVNPVGEGVLGLEATNTAGQGVSILDRTLANSREPAIAALQLPSSDGVHFADVEIGGEPHIVVLTRLAPFQLWTDASGVLPEAWTLGFVVPHREVYMALASAKATIERRGAKLVHTLVALSAVTLAVVMLGLAFVARRATSDLAILAERAAAVMKGDYATRVHVRSSDEIGSLAVAFDAMAAQVQSHTEHLELTVAARTEELAVANREISQLNQRLRAENVRLGAEQERLGRELEIAATIQLSMLPREPLHAEFEFAGRMVPATEVGGDFYDVLTVPGDPRLWITVGDVSSHGLGAGLVMMLTQAAFHSVFEIGNELGVDTVLRTVNRLIHTGSVVRLGGRHYLTAQLLMYRGDGVFDCAGSHLWPIAVRPDTGACRRLEMVGPWLGVVPELPAVPVHRFQLAQGEVVCLYSDGIIEARSSDGAMFEVARLETVLTRELGAGRPLSEVADAILREVAEFAQAQDDDRTVLLFRRRTA